jgi:hypothetical protein
LAPLDKHREAVQEEGRRITGKFLDMFTGRKASGTTYEGQDGYLEGERVTVYVETSSHSIGD